MHTCTRFPTFACAGPLVVSAAAAGTQGGPQPGGASDCQQVLADRFDSLPVNLLDQETIDAVILLREEEKLARDVYLTFTALYDLPVFPNIAWSEQNHMDLVAIILERYGIADPAAGNGIGEFTNPELQDLFDDLLVPMGEASLTGALNAGATIEDLDIFHLDHILAHSEFDDINLIVQNMVAVPATT